MNSQNEQPKWTTKIKKQNGQPKGTTKVNNQNRNDQNEQPEGTSRMTSRVSCTAFIAGTNKAPVVFRVARTEVGHKLVDTAWQNMENVNCEYDRVNA